MERERELGVIGEGGIEALGGSPSAGCVVE